MCILIRSKPPIFQSPQCTRHGKTFDTRISVSWLPDLDSYAVSVGQPGDLNSRISGFSSEVDHGSWSCLGLLLDEYTCRLKSGGLLLTEYNFLEKNVTKFSRKFEITSSNRVQNPIYLNIYISSSWQQNVNKQLVSHPSSLLYIFVLIVLFFCKL